MSLFQRDARFIPFKQLSVLVLLTTLAACGGGSGNKSEQQTPIVTPVELLNVFELVIQIHRTPGDGDITSVVATTSSDANISSLNPLSVDCQQSSDSITECRVLTMLQNDSPISVFQEGHFQIDFDIQPQIDNVDVDDITPISIYSADFIDQPESVASGASAQNFTAYICVDLHTGEVRSTEDVTFVPEARVLCSQ